MPKPLTITILRDHTAASLPPVITALCEQIAREDERGAVLVARVLRSIAQQLQAADDADRAVIRSELAARSDRRAAPQDYDVDALENWRDMARQAADPYHPDDEPPSITCPRCDRTSYNPNDISHRYCGACHRFHNEP